MQTLALQRRNLVAMSIAAAFGLLVFLGINYYVAHAASIGGYDQCSNDAGTGYGAPDTGCRWINGALGPSNSSYSEGDSTVQRAWLTGFEPGSTHTVTFQYGTTKAGKHAYDFLTKWDWTENWITLADICQDITGCTTSSADQSGTIPHDSLLSANWEANQGGGARTFQIHGGTINDDATGVSAPVLVSGTYAGDSETSVTVTFTVANSGSMCSTQGQNTECAVAIFFGAHVAKSLSWIVENGTTGAGTISGKPYHVALSKLDGGSVGNRDNQMDTTGTFGTITIVKDANPNDAQDFNFRLQTQDQSTIVNFPLDDDANATLSNTKTFSSIPTGSYIASELLSAPQGWVLSNIVCVDPSTNSAVNIGAGTASITLNADETVTCTFTNIKPGSITIIKDTVPDDAQDFAFTTSGTGLSNFSLDDDANVTLPNTQNFNNLAPGSYSVTEGAVAGYSVTAINCVETTSNSSVNLGNRVASITLDAGESVTCTFVNTLQQGHLTLQKTVVNDNGGTALDTAWTLSASGPTPISGAEGNTAVTNAAVNAGSYDLSESAGPTGYTNGTTWVCTGGTQNDGDTVTIAPGENVTCVITNNDNAPVLHLRKVVVNDNGGTATVSNFTLTANGTGANDLSGTSPVDSGAGLLADTFALSETNVTGYTASSWVCVGGSQNGASITLGLGQEATCTITNNDNAAHLIVIKHVVNDNGGTAVAGDFTTNITGVTTTNQSAAGAEAPGVDNVLTTVGAYSVDEGAHVGYAKTLSADCSGTIALGESKTCTITNDDISPKLTLIKHVVNDNGGTKVVSDFVLKIDTSVVTSGSSNNVNAGAHTASEVALTGYTASVWSGDCAADGSITLALADDKTCEITNDDQQAFITVVKVVTNNNGGAAQPNDFALTLEGSAVSSGVAVPVNPGTYTAGETLVSGYSFVGFTGDCDSNGGTTVALGESKTCTLTNDDIAPKLHLRKVVVNDNGGTAAATEWTLTANGTGSNDLSGSTPVDSDSGLLADTFALSETGPAGYTASDWVCVGGNQNGSSITVGIGGEATCTITNNDISPKLIVIKHVVNDNGGTAVAGDFTMNVTATNPSDASFPGVEAPGTEITLDAGAYSVAEPAVAGYLTTYSADCTGTAVIGQTKTCTVTNDDKPATLIIVKNSEPNDCQNFAFTMTGQNGFLLDDDSGVVDCTAPDTNEAQTKTFTNLSANTNYTVAETLPNTFWLHKGVACVVTGTETPYAFTPVTNGATVSLPLDGNVTCTFNNEKVSPTRTQGFWQTHTAYTTTVFNSFAGTMVIGNGITNQDPIDTTGKLFGAFYSNIAKKTDGKQRNALDKARMQLAQQLAAAKLNCQAFGCTPSVQAMIAAADSHYATGTAAQILADAALVDAYNNSGDTIIIGNAGSATPLTSKSIANLTFWDLP